MTDPDCLAAPATESALAEVCAQTRSTNIAKTNIAKWALVLHRARTELSKAYAGQQQGAEAEAQLGPQQ